MEKQMDYTVNFDLLDKTSLPLVGGKNASLGEMIKAGIHVPPGFAVTTDSFLSFITETGINERIFSALDGLRADDVSSLDEVSAEIQSLIVNTEMNNEVSSAIAQSYEALCDSCKISRVPVAVRSSATAEDLPNASFAGQQDTYLWVVGAENIINSVRKCWASLYTPRAIDYRNKNNFPHDKVLISVGVQKMVNSKAAGVMFTLNPTNGDPSKVVIEGSWGLGETVVSGSVNPDKFVVDKVTRELSEKTISMKHIRCVHDPEGGEVKDVDVPEEIQSVCCLEDMEIRSLVEVARIIEKHYGRAMDIEWAIDEDFTFPESVFIVQARPETVWSQRKKEPVLGKKTGYQLLMAQAMKRIKIPG